MKLSVIVPAYNEEKRLPYTLREIDKYLAKQDYDYEIIVANDGSTDRTALVVKDMVSEIKGLRLIDNSENHGKGYVVYKGLLEAKGDFRIFTDSDNSTSIDQIEKMWPEFDNGCDIVIGSRDIKGAKLVPPQPWYREMLGKVFCILVKIIVGLKHISDSQCGFKAFKKEVVEEIVPRCKIEGFGFDPEILVLAQKMHYKIKEIPVVWKNDAHSKVSVKSMAVAVFELLKIRWNLITGKYGI